MKSYYSKRILKNISKQKAGKSNNSHKKIASLNATELIFQSKLEGMTDFNGLKLLVYHTKVKYTTPNTLERVNFD